MDSAQNKSAKKEKGNVTRDARTAKSEPNFVTKIKLPEQRQTDKKADLNEQKRRLDDQGRSDKV